jgi:hypothetical protein
MPAQENLEQWSQQIPFGKPRSEADKHFAERNNDTGAWRSVLISTEVTDQGKRTVYRYRWDRKAFYLDADVARYDLTFVDDALIKFERVLSGSASHSAPSVKSGMGFLCKDAIARGDESAIRVHCN